MNSKSPSSEENPDFELDLDRIFSAPQSEVKPRTDSVLPKAKEIPDEDTIGEKKRPFVKFERRGDDASRKFTRVVARPATVIAAQAAVAHSHPTPNAATRSATANEAPAAAPFGKRKNLQDTPELVPNQAIDVLNQLWTHSTLGWLDKLNMGRIFKTLLGVALAVVVCGLLWKYVGEMISQRRDSDSGAAVDAASQKEKSQAARDALKAFLNATTWDEKQKYVQDPQRIAAQMQAYYEGGGKDPSFEVVQSRSTDEADGKGVFGFFWNNPTTNAPCEIFVWETAGGMKVDWDSFVGLGAMPWSSFCDQRPQDAKQMRVDLQKAEDYAGRYADSSSYQCYTITHRSGSQTLRGYVLRSDRWAQDILKSLDSNGRASLNVYLRFEPTADPDQVFIAGIKRNLLR